MTSKLVVNTIEADTGISSVSFASSISMNSTSKFHFSATGIDIGADTNINRPTSGVLGFNINNTEKLRIDNTGWMGAGQTSRDHVGQVAAFKNTSNTNSWLSVNVNNNTGIGGVVFGDSDTWAPAYIQYNHSSNIMQFISNGSERLRIKSNGQIVLGIDGTNSELTFSQDGSTGVKLSSTTTGFGGYNTFTVNSAQFVHTYGSNERLRIDSSGRLLIGTTTEGAAAADNLTVSSSDNTGITIRSGTTHNGSIYFSDATSGIGEYAGQIDYDHNNNSLNFYADNDQCLRLLNDKSVSVSDKLVLENGTVFLNKHSVGVGTTTQAGRNAGVSTATGTIIYNAETEKVQVYANATWRNVGSLEPDQSSGYYSSLSAAQSAGLSHYWPGNSSTALISGLTPDDRKGNPTFNNKESNGYGATNPFFHFAGQTGGDNPTGYRYTHSADWVGHSFSICYWVKVMQEVTEGESTYVQLGNHSGQRSMFAMSCSGNTNLRGKTITIGDDNANDQIQYEFNNWIHVGVRYNYGANSATYYKNGVQTENHTFNQSLSVGTGNNNIYLGYGYWNGSTSNKESCSRMSDIGIWDSSSINGAIFGEIYRAGRIVKGY